ncbi:MAG: holo-ACP synthase [Bacilli bacterium]|jgi:holo-[acyl-carrier protein] synthase
MRIVGVGIDLAKISRYEGQKELAKRVLSESEYQEYLHSHDQASFLASRFAVKESYVKASGDKQVDYRCLEIREDETGKPSLYLNGLPTKSFVSLTHDEEAGAIVILYEEDCNK